MEWKKKGKEKVGCAGANKADAELIALARVFAGTRSALREVHGAELRAKVRRRFRYGAVVMGRGCSGVAWFRREYRLTRCANPSKGESAATEGISAAT